MDYAAYEFRGLGKSDEPTVEPDGCWESKIQEMVQTCFASCAEDVKRHLVEV